MKPDLLHLYKSTSWKTRLHIQGRWFLFPFPALEQYIPNGDVFTDLGCGYGLWPFYLAKLRTNALIWGFDPDREKIRVSSEVGHANDIKNANFDVGLAQEVVVPQSDLITLIDVLYLVPFELQTDIVQKAALSLNSGGRLMIKEMSHKPLWKYTLNQLEEWLAVRVFNITYGSRFYFREEGAWEHLLTENGLMVTKVALDSGYLHPHVLFIGDKV